jgi:hypothetical protein
LQDKHYQHKVVKYGQYGGDNCAISAKVDTKTDISVRASDIKANKNQ